MADDTLHPYFERELAFLRSMLAGQYTDDYPKVSSRLKLGPGGTSDPHVQFLLDGVALLAGRIQKKLDDEFPQVAEALLSVLYPHFINPIPSCSIAQFSQKKNVQSHVDRGATIELEPTDSGGVCYFRTCSPVTIWPIKVTQGEFRPRPYDVPPTPHPVQWGAALKLQLTGNSPSYDFSKCPPTSLRLYLDSRETPDAYRLYELLLTSTVKIVVAESATDPNGTVLSQASLRATGFSDDEAMIPVDARTFSGYRLISEYFALPQKFLFIDFTGTERAFSKINGGQADIYFLLDTDNVSLKDSVSWKTVRLGCCPIINLKTERIEPEQIQHTSAEFCLDAPDRATAAQEVYSIQEVRTSFRDGSTRMYAPFYSFDHHSTRKPPYWFARRRVARSSQGPTATGELIRNDVHLAFVDEDFNTIDPEMTVLHVTATCFNGNAPHDQSKESGHPSAKLTDGAEVAVACLLRPTAALMPPSNYGAVWRLVSHLCLNHLSVSGENAEQAFREILGLHNRHPPGSAQADLIQKGIRKIATAREVRRLGRRGGFGQGLKVTVTLDETEFPGGGAYLFGQVLDRFFGLYTSINSFSRLSIKTEQRELPWEWPMHAGGRSLIGTFESSQG